MKTAAEQANTALANGDISQEQYDALQREIIETEQDLKKLETQANQLATAMRKIAATGEKLKTTGNNISSAGQKLLPVTAAVTGMGAASLKTAWKIMDVINGMKMACSHRTTTITRRKII